MQRVAFEWDDVNRERVRRREAAVAAAPSLAPVCADLTVSDITSVDFTRTLTKVFLHSTTAQGWWRA